MSDTETHIPRPWWRRRAWLVAVSAVLLVVAGGLLWLVLSPQDGRTADERLAEIEAARAVPEAENAARIYGRMLEDPNATSLRNDFPQSVIPETFARARREPWLSRDLPELAGWVRDHQFVIAQLLEASRLDQCRFALNPDITNTGDTDRTMPIRQWGFLLASAANNDLGQGQIEAALAKWRGLIRIGNHLRQQPLLLDHLLANDIERMALEPISRFLVTGNPTPAQLQKIEAMPLPTKDRTQEYDKETRLVDKLRLQRLREQYSPLNRLRFDFELSRLNRILGPEADRKSLFENAWYAYRRTVTAARGLRILVALRRYERAKGRWPESLDEIAGSLSNEILTDPLNHGPFVYQRAGEAFRLYSMGLNNKDDDGRWDPDAGRDDWLIWRPREDLGKDEHADEHE